MLFPFGTLYLIFSGRLGWWKLGSYMADAGPLSGQHKFNATAGISGTTTRTARNTPRRRLDDLSRPWQPNKHCRLFLQEYLKANKVEKPTWGRFPWELESDLYKK